MKIEVIENEPCKLTVHYEADAGQILDKRAEVLNAFKKAPVSGFRPGKASIDAIKLHYRDQIEESLKRALAEDAYHETLFEKKLRPHGAPRFNSLLMVDGKFICEFDLFVKPDFELAQYKNLEIPTPHFEANEDALTEGALQDLRVRFGEVTPFTEEDIVSIGDNAIIDYEATINGSKVESLCGSGEMITVGKSPVEGFDNHLIGMMVGDSKEFDIVAPTTSLPSLADKTVHFKVALNMGSKTIPAPLNDELAKKTGRQSLADLRAYIH